ncbi:uncharacterized protein LOC106161164 [Lingula anatina]|uniref:Uncharacterized protein LOC106161164 n=1 Tax=Lingula anatina TaxID=7574 RepID=A0A2R2MSY5_LINAN|nr:uncharacterized protein LOC106161164 [Lingula anatina]|eukprot:XP_023933366.1 uncharacterized protein LOC106161164 [Lingula anatina]
MYCRYVLHHTMPRSLAAMLVLVSLLHMSQGLEDWEEGIYDQLGSVSLPTSTQNADAQKYFIFGVKLVISFWHDLAEESFRKAQNLDPSFGMAYWGEALCKKWFLWNSEFPDDANAIFRRMDANNSVWNPREGTYGPAPRTPSEDLYIDALRMLFRNASAGNLQQRNRLFADKMKLLYDRSLNDDVGASYYALALLEINRVDEARTVLDAVLQRSPNHPAGLHFSLHAFDFHHPGVAERGLAAAEKYPQVVKVASHGDHMPAHIFIRIGLWQEAVDADVLALKAGDDFANERKNGDITYDKWNRYHSLEYLQYYLLQQGRFTKAAEYMERMRSALQAVPDDLFFRQTWYRMIARQFLESRNYDDVQMTSLSFDQPAYVPLENDLFWSSYTEAGFLQARAMEAMKLNSSRASALADSAITRMDELISKTAETPAWSYVTKAIRILKLQLQATRESSDGRVTQALSLMRQAAAIQDTMVLLTTSPTLLFLPTYEFYGDLMLGSGDGAAAVPLYTRALKDYPNRTASLLGLGRAHVMAGDNASALTYYERLYDAIWTSSDDFKARRDAGRVLSGLRVSPTMTTMDTDEMWRTWIIIAAGIVFVVLIIIAVVIVAYLNRAKYRKSFQSDLPPLHKYDVHKKSDETQAYENPAFSAYNKF